MIIRELEPMSRHTTFGVGGPARYYLIPENTGEVRAAIDFADARQLPYMVVGGGSNLLFSDREYQGVVIEIGKAFSDVSVHMDNTVTVKAGMRLRTMSTKLMNMGLKGFEFASGIPGTVGGAITMNAGAYGGEIKDFLREVTVMNSMGDLETITADRLEMSYRHSALQDTNSIVLSGTFEFESGNKGEIQEKIKELNERRREKQPLEYKSAGSTFKRPEGYFAGKLIEEAGLRGYHIGGAEVSSKHCGFIVNTGDATAAEINSLIKHVQRIVSERFQVELEPEIRMVGDFSWDMELF